MGIKKLIVMHRLTGRWHSLGYYGKQEKTFNSWLLNLILMQPSLWLLANVKRRTARESVWGHCSEAEGMRSFSQRKDLCRDAYSRRWERGYEIGLMQGIFKSQAIVDQENSPSVWLTYYSIILKITSLALEKLVSC